MFTKLFHYLDFNSIHVSIKYLAISAFFTGIGLGYFFTLIVIILKYNQFSDSTIGIIAASFSFGLITAGLTVSKVLEKFGLYKTMLFSVSLQTLMIIIMFSYLNTHTLIICHIIMGIFGGMNWMTMDTWVNVVSNNKNRGKAIAFYNLSITVGFAMGPLLISVLGSQGFLPITIAIFLMLIRSPVIIAIKQYAESVKIPQIENKLNFSILKIAPFIFLVIFIGGINDSTLSVLFPAYMINFDFTDRQVGFLLFIGLFSGILFQPLIGVLTDKINKRFLIFILLLLHCIWPMMIHNYYELSFIRYLAVMISGITSVSLYTVTLAYLGQRYKPGKLVIATSMFIVIYESGEFFGPGIIGYMMDFFGNKGLVYSLFISTTIVLITGLLRTYYTETKELK